MPLCLKTEPIGRIGGVEVTLSTSNFKTRNLFAEVIMKVNDVCIMANIYLTSGGNGLGHFRYWNRGWTPSVHVAMSRIFCNVHYC